MGTKYTMRKSKLTQTFVPFMFLVVRKYICFTEPAEDSITKVTKEKTDTETRRRGETGLKAGSWHRTHILYTESLPYTMSCLVSVASLLYALCPMLHAFDTTDCGPRTTDILFVFFVVSILFLFVHPLGLAPQ